MRKSRNKETLQRDIQIGHQVKFARTLKEMSQTDLGLKLGISGAQIAKYETGKNTISYEKLQEICDVLEVSIDKVVSQNKRIDEHPFFTNAIKTKTKNIDEGEIFELVTLFVKIKSSSARRTIIDMVKLVKPYE